jgi:AbrB family looped-hinge helix DNA binding protein
MKSVTVSSRGQLAIPKEIREALQIKAGDKFTIEVKNRVITLKPAITLTIPKEQAYFWAPEVQEKMKKVREEHEKGEHKEYTVNSFLGELDRREK